MKYIFVLAAVLVSSCTDKNVKPALPPGVDVVHEVRTVPVIPTITAPPRPDLYIYRLGLDDIKDPGKVAQYYRISIEQLIDHIDSLNRIINEYNAAASKVRSIDSVVKSAQTAPPK